MNYKMIKYNLGAVLKIESILLVIPLIVSFIYQENNYMYFLIPIVISLLLGQLFSYKKPENKTIHAKEGLITVALVWIILSFFSALPLYLSQEIPSFTDAYFETVSGLTTTGSTILNNIEALSHSMLFIRSFNHWIGGMGILVFALMFIPTADARSLQIMKAEVPGPIVGKLVSRIKMTARILYIIYAAMTAILVILLCFGGMPLFDSLLNAFGTAGTGGLAIKSNSIQYYNSAYIDIVITVFMILFGINFNLFYLLIAKKTMKAMKSEELKYYLLIIGAAILLIMVNARDIFPNIFENFRHVSFQVSSFITTTGYTSTNFDLWPNFSRDVLLLLMFIGGCAGSTAGGLKVSRIVILFKMGINQIKKTLHPHSVSSVKFEERKADDAMQSSITAYLFIYLLLFVASMLIISLDQFDFYSNFSAVATSINNVGPGFNAFGATSNFSALSDLSKWTMTLNMLIGRLEIYPILLLFIPTTWREK